MNAILKHRVHTRVAASFPNDGAVASAVRALLREEEPLLQGEALDALVLEVTNEITGLGPLEPILGDPTVTEVMVNGARGIYVERAGEIERVAIQLCDEEILQLAERVIAPLGLRLDRGSPIVDARLVDGSRFHAVIPPLAVDGPAINIRRFPATNFTMESFGLPGEPAEFLATAVRQHANILISGATSSGKTSFLNALSANIVRNERVVTIEETSELSLALPHVVRLEARRANTEGAGAISVRDLVRAALRMRPDRLVIGEVRGGEAFDMLQACNTGHDGSLCTIHANSPADALSRLAELCVMSDVPVPYDTLRSQVHRAFDLVIQLRRGVEGKRVVTEVAEVASGDVLATATLFGGASLTRERHYSRPARKEVS